MDKNKESSVRALMEEMHSIQVKSNRFMKLLTHNQGISDNILLLLLNLKLFKFLKITEISDTFFLTPGAATKMCDKLEQLGLVERVRLKDDRRVVRVTLTHKGEEKVDEIFSKFSPEQLGTIANTLSEINHLFKNIEEAL